MRIKRSPATTRVFERASEAAVRRRIARPEVNGAESAVRDVAAPPGDPNSPSVSTVRWPILLFLPALFVPWAIFVGSFRMSLYRVVLLVMFLPCLRIWASRKAGPAMFADIAILMFSFLCTVSLIANHGVGSSPQPGGIGIVETVGPYFLARCYIRGADDFRNMFRLLFRTVLVLLPFALIEFFTGHNLWRDMFVAVWPVEGSGHAVSRSGLTRVQMGFDDPTELGCCAFAVSLSAAYFVPGDGEPCVCRLFRVLVGGASQPSHPFPWSLSNPTFLSGTTPFVERFADEVRRIVGRSCWCCLFHLGSRQSPSAKGSLLTILASFFVFDSGRSYLYRRCF